MQEETAALESELVDLLKVDQDQGQTPQNEDQEVEKILEGEAMDVQEEVQVIEQPQHHKQSVEEWPTAAEIQAMAADYLPPAATAQPDRVG